MRIRCLAEHLGMSGVYVDSILEVDSITRLNVGFEMHVDILARNSKGDYWILSNTPYSEIHSAFDDLLKEGYYEFSKDVKANYLDAGDLHLYIYNQ